LLGTLVFFSVKLLVGTQKMLELRSLKWGTRWLTQSLGAVTKMGQWCIATLFLYGKMKMNENAT
jgi:hypothetical protein